MKTKLMYSEIKWVLLVCLLLFGCATHRTIDEENLADDKVTTGDGIATTNEEPPEVMLFDGKRYIRRQKAVFSSSDDVEEYEKRTIEPPSGPTTVEYLAEMLRPIALFRGWEYEKEELDYELARKALNNEFLGFKGEKSTIEREGRIVLDGNDEREYQGGNRHTAQARQLAFFTTGGTGNFVGPKTLITAAHVIHYVTGWASTFTQCLYRKQDQSDSTMRAPGTQFTDCPTIPSHKNDGLQTPIDPYGWEDCFISVIPSGWRTSGGSQTYDYAVLSFSNESICGDINPGAMGNMPIMVEDESYIQNYNIGTFGYPSETQGVDRYQPPWGTGFPYTSGQMWGHTASGASVDIIAQNHDIYFRLDITNGQSGSCIWVSAEDYYCVGIVTNNGNQQIGNRGTHIDSTVFSFIQNVSPDY